MNDSIIRYFRLSYKINVDKRRMFNRSNDYHNQSYHTRTEMTDEGELRVRAFQVENQVCDYLESIQLIEKRMKKKEKKNRYFNDYLQRLTPDAREYLYKRYVEGLDVTVNEEIERETMDEIREIEQAIRFMNGEKPGVKTEKEDGVKLDLLLNMEDGTELEFDELIDVLGV